MTDPLRLPMTISPDQAVRWLEVLLEWYSSQEAEYYNKLWGAEDSRWSEGTENEWFRYRQESAALRAGIDAIRTTQGKSESQQEKSSG